MTHVTVSGPAYGLETRQLAALRGPFLDPPGERAVADSLRRPPAGAPVDPPAGAGRVAVAGLQIGPTDPVRHYPAMCIAGAPFPGTFKPGTVPGDTATQTP